MSYTGHITNSIDTKEDKLMSSNLAKDWRNGMQHNIPIQGTFTLFNYINVTPAFNFTDRTYLRKVNKSWDEATGTVVNDTINGLHNVYNWNFAMSASTKLYGFYVPSRKIFGDKVQAIRHVLTPQVSFSYAPDFGAARYGYYQTYQRTNADGSVDLVEYSPYEGSAFGYPTRGKTGNLSFSLANNVEMKMKSDKDSTGFKKVSIIDNFALQMSYNMAAKEKPWSDLGMDIRLKWWKNYTFNMHAVFATYAYELDKNGRPYVGNHTEWGYGRFGRFQGMSQNFSFTLTPEKLRKLFNGGDDEEDSKEEKEGIDTGIVFVIIASCLYYFSGSSPGPLCVALITFLGVGACLFRQMYWHRNRGSIVLCAGLALMLYELGTFAVGMFSGLTRWDRLSTFAVTGALSIAVMIPLYSLINRIGQIGGNTWKE